MFDGGAAADLNDSLVFRGAASVESNHSLVNILMTLTHVASCILILHGSAQVRSFQVCSSSEKGHVVKRRWLNVVIQTSSLENKCSLKTLNHSHT